MVFSQDQAYEVLHPHFQNRIFPHESLAHHSSFGVGGQADIWLVVQTQKELIDLICLCAEQRWPLLVVGEGTNILYADAGVRGIVAQIALPNYRIEEQPDHSALVTTEAGVRWAQLLPALAPLGWGGLEFAAGIPGTLGAGVISNVGTRNQNLGQALEWVEVLDARGCNIEEAGQLTVPTHRRYQHDELDLGYRHSRFREQRRTHLDEHSQLIVTPRGLIEPTEIIIELALHLHRRNPSELQAVLDKQKQECKQTDPASRHAGSIFKDPPQTTAHALIQQAGLCGKISGKAQISAQNGNYILNLGNASAHDVLTLIKDAHQRVLAQSGIQLGLNVELLGEWT